VRVSLIFAIIVSLIHMDGVDYVTRMNLYNLIFQMVELLYEL